MTTQELLDEIALVATTNGSNDITGLKLKNLLNKLVQNLHNKESDAYPAGVQQFEQRNTNAVTFDKPAIYGTKEAPRSGAITLDHTNGKLVMAVMFHNDVTEPAQGAEWDVLAGGYQLGMTNKFMFLRCASNNVLVTISQSV